MGYYMRYITTDEPSVDFNELESVLRGIDSSYSLERDPEDETEAEILNGGEIYGVAEVNVPGDGLFEDEIGELIEFVEDVEGTAKTQVIEGLKNAKSIFCVQVLFQGRSTEDTLAKLDPVWNWLIESKSGLMQADGEGYYDRTGLLLEVK